MLRQEDGFTLIELIVVITIIAILLGMAIGFHSQARDRAGDATARANLRIATPAIESYRSDHATYTGMTLAALQTAYSPGVTGVEILSADDAGYCMRAVAAGSTWYKQGTNGPITETACS